MRRVLVAALAVVAVALTGCSTAPEVTPTGETTTVEVRMLENRFEPDLIEVPLGNRLVIELINDDLDLHDLELDSGVASSRLGSGDSETIDAGVISEDLDGWCTVPPHREHGMVLTIETT